MSLIEPAAKITIRRVRIAGIEKWCAQNLSDLMRFPWATRIEGMLVEIVEESMVVNGDFHNGEPTRSWRLTDDSGRKMYETARIGFAPPKEGVRLCEHMLEHDKPVSLFIT